jgi:hypothetical protein
LEPVESLDRILDVALGVDGLVGGVEAEAGAERVAWSIELVVDAQTDREQWKNNNGKF